MRTYIRIFYTLFICFIIISFKSFGQLESKDSLLIEKYYLTGLVDSTNSTLPKDIRKITVEYIEKIGLNPNEYYISRYFTPKKAKAQNYSEICILQLYRIGALRDMAYGQIHFGGYGEIEDDIQIIFSKDYREIITKINTE